MPLDRLALILVCVIIAAGATVWIATLLTGADYFPSGGYALLPAALIGTGLFRVIAWRISHAEGDHRDGMDH